MGTKHSSINLSKSIELKALVSLAHFTTIKVGGQAEWFAEPKNLSELKLIIEWAAAKRIKCQIIGAGSNLLINDNQLNGVSICMRRFHGWNINKNTGFIEAYGGEPIPTLARKAAHAGLSGLEWAIGIPGTVGGAAVMNAGAQGGCTSERLISVRVLPIGGEEPYEISQKELEFDYRYSRLQEEKLIVLSARFRLEPGHDQEELTYLTNKNLHHRTSTQPYHLPNCGSVFRNPEPQKAGFLIEKLGLKGHRMGDAEISKIHANFIVNKGNASAKDIQKLIKLIQHQVQNAHGLTLHQEVKTLGFLKND